MTDQAIVTDEFVPLRLALDWSAFDGYGDGDAYAALPAHGGGFGKAAALCIGSRQCQKGAADKGLMCPSFRVTSQALHSTRGRAALLAAGVRHAEPAPAGCAEIEVSCSS